MDTLPVCRVCMQSSLEYIDLESPLSAELDGLTYLDGFNACTQLNATFMDEYPKNLCVSCGNELRIAYEFIRKAEYADQVFKNKWEVKSEFEHFDFEEGTVDLTIEHEYFMNENEGKQDLDSPNVIFVTNEDCAEPELEIECNKDESDSMDIQNTDIELRNESPNSEPYQEDDEEEENDDEERHDEYEHESESEEISSISEIADSKPNTNELQLDIALKHTKTIMPKLEETTSELYKCVYCEKCFTSEEKLTFHIMSHVGELLYKCSVCDEEFHGKVHLAKHITDVHEKSRSDSKHKQYIRCEHCDKLVNIKWLKQHINRVHCNINDEERKPSYKRYLCSKCPKAFVSAESLKRHLETHDENRQATHSCEHCGKSFYREVSYRAHLKIHSPNRQKSTCEICGRQFSFVYGLTMHMKIHTGGDFECSVCAKKFVRKMDLEIHMRFHTGDYPFQCEYCDKRFAIKSHLKDHTSKHLGIMFKCAVCGQEFRNAATLRVHKYVHTTMPFKCGDCGKGFDSRYKIRRHLITVHKSEITDSQFDKMFPKRNVVPIKGPQKIDEEVEVEEEPELTVDNYQEDVDYILMIDEEN